ncbi:radial spoke 3 protein [Ochromonadaceae sp. CCMP2298]|nr:radial spoke 3 protein [Ochromonadaceae sp. CCMP2298]|mmetsp:Transcript_4738/g.10673  ORF Transcript_4738/g.10673 Transcript_4738/m.10673 type:complete len:365 (+) Transcript_4738:90-1184(+)
MQTEETFEYSTQPHAAPTKKKNKYRSEGEENVGPDGISNIMYDARVVRGNTYAAKVMTTSLKKDLDRTSKKQPKQSKMLGYARRSSTPPPVSGRTHMNMQTEDFLEEITDRPIEQDVETQTTAALDRPASPLFVRAKIGFDAETQIENGDLFDFDLEVEPILEVLVGKTIHVSMLELMQEEELDAIRLQQEEFEAVRNVELAEVQRLEAEIKRKAAEKDRRIAQEKKRLEDRRRLEETVAARAFSDQFLGDLHLNVFDMLQEQGHFFDPVQREVEQLFMPALIEGLTRGGGCYEAASIIAAELLEGARAKAKAFEAEAIKLRKEMQARVAAEQEKQLAIAEEARLAAEAAAKSAEDAENAGEEE